MHPSTPTPPPPPVPRKQDSSGGGVLPRLRYLNPGFDGSGCIPTIAPVAPGVEELDLSSSTPLFPGDETEPLRGLHALRRLVVTLGRQETQVRARRRARAGGQLPLRLV